MRIEPTHKRIRAYLGGELVADTTHARLVWEHDRYPAYYFPIADVTADVLVDAGPGRTSSTRGQSVGFDVKAGDRVAAGAAWSYPESPVEELRGLVRFDWAAMDAWFEEDEQVQVHPRDPYKRVDVLNSSRHVRVVLDGVTVAESHQPRLLFETSLPTRYYLPLTDVRQDLLRPSDRTTRCPYKGTANYWSVDTGTQVHEDVVWTYRFPIPECAKIAGLACFYNERVDLYVDGELQDRPQSPFSR